LNGQPHIWVHKELCAGGRYDGLVGQLKGKQINLYLQLVLRWVWSVYCCCLNKLKTTKYVIVKLFLLADPATQGKALVLAEQIRDPVRSCKQLRLKTGSQVHEEPNEKSGSIWCNLCFDFW
jgi:histidyl-tRNA synthetase